MFEFYLQNINLDDEEFLNFIRQFLTKNNMKNPETIPYSELYSLVQNAIREFLAKRE